MASWRRARLSDGCIKTRSISRRTCDLNQSSVIQSKEIDDGFRLVSDVVWAPHNAASAMTASRSTASFGYLVRWLFIASFRSIIDADIGSCYTYISRLHVRYTRFFNMRASSKMRKETVCSFQRHQSCMIISDVCLVGNHAIINNGKFKAEAFGQITMNLLVFSRPSFCRRWKYVWVRIALD